MSSRMRRLAEVFLGGRDWEERMHERLDWDAVANMRVQADYGTTEFETDDKNVFYATFQHRDGDHTIYVPLAGKVGGEVVFVDEEVKKEKYV
ncbi:MAG: hypothetical protein ABEI58_00275 [Candidatus Nanohaloarchaea archaeon]